MSDEKPIRLFVDAHVFDQEFQGTRTFIREIYTRLAGKKGLLLYLAAYDTENLEKVFPQSDGVRYIKFRSKSSLIRLSYEIPALLKRHAIDYAHFQYICPPVKRCKYIVTLHDVIFSEYPDEFSLLYRMGKKMLFKRSAGMSDIITTVSEYSKRSIRKFLDVDPGIPIHVVPNGVGPEFFEPYDKQQSKDRLLEKYGLGKFILYVSRIEPRKNHVFLLKAYLQEELYKKGYSLVLLGHQSIKIPAFDKLLQELPDHIRKYIFLDSRIGDKDLLDFYKAAELFVYPSRAEGFGIPPLEAAALRIPVICSNTSAMEEYAFFGDYHIDPFDLGLLAAKLSEMLRNPPSAHHLEEISLTIRHQYSWDLAAEKFYQLLPVPLGAGKNTGDLTNY